MKVQIDELRELIYGNKLGFRQILDQNEKDYISSYPTDALAAVLLPFIITFQGQTPFLDEDIKEGMKNILLFLTAEQPTFEYEISVSIDHLFYHSLRLTSSVSRTHSPVGYFMKKACKLPGFALLGIAARNLIIDESPHVIPALLASCAVIPAGTKHFNLRAEDITAMEKYHKKDGSALLPTTQAGYVTILNRLLKEIKEVYSILGYGSAALFLEPEETELERENQKKKKLRNLMKGAKYISEPSVLKPHTLELVILRGQLPKISNLEGYNMLILRLLITLVFHYGSKISDLIKLIVSNLESNDLRIQVPITADELLQEQFAYIPLPDEVLDWIISLLEYRNAISQLSPDDSLFALHHDSMFKGITDKEMKIYFKDLNSDIGVTINERVLYESHRSYYTYFGKLNQIIDDRISNRMEPEVYIPRMYTRTSLAQIRTAHRSAFDEVCRAIGVHRA